jgi:hypothetical protein
MELRLAEVTVKVVLPMIEPKVAVIVVVPAETQVATPLALMVANAVLDEFHVTDAVMSCEVPSEYVPVAVKRLVNPAATEEFGGVIAMEPSVAEVTVNDALPAMEPEVAVIVAVPAAPPVARPLMLTVATVVFDDFHNTKEVMSSEVPSE